MSIRNGNDTGAPIVRGISDSDLSTVLILVAIVGPGVVVGVAATKWSELTEWCVHHHLLATSAADPMVIVPWSGGAGLDFWRVLLIVAALAASGFGGVWTRNALRRAVFERRARHGRV